MNTSRRTYLRGVGLSAFGLTAVSTGVSAQQQSPNTVFDLDFTDAADAGGVGPTSPGWQVDRKAPYRWETDTFDGDDRLEIDIDENGPTSGFYAYQGKKYLPKEDAHWKTGYGTVLSYRFYIDPEWEGDGNGQQTGMWGVIADDDDTIVAYPILEYQDSDASDTDEARFRVYSYEEFIESDDGDGDDGWVDVGLPQSVDPDEGGWVDCEMRWLRHGQFGSGNGKKLKGGKVNWHVNGSLIYEDNGIPYFATNYDGYGDPTQFFEPILNSRNFGANELYYYDDISLKAPGKRGKGK
jgi:hypothetical protein